MEEQKKQNRRKHKRRRGRMLEQVKVGENGLTERNE